MRFLTVLSLTLALVGLSVAAGVAKGTPPAVDQFTICSGHKTLTIWVDQDGEPVEVQASCPDCAMAGIVLPADWVPPAPVSLWADTVQTALEKTHSIPLAGALWPPVRAPPLFLHA